MAGGVLLRGHHGGAGEFGHLPVSDDGPECECGNRGCLEAMVADPALVAQAVAAGIVPEGVTVAEGVDRLLGAAGGGDPRAVAIFEQAGTHLGRAVGGLVNVFDPALVIVGGEGTAAWAHLGQSFSAAVAAHTFPPLGGVEIVVDPWDDRRWAAGAAARVLGASVATPLYDTSPEDGVRERLVTTAAVPA